MERVFVLFVVCLLAFLVAVSAVKVDVSVSVGGSKHTQNELSEVDQAEIDEATPTPTPVVKSAAPNYKSISSITDLAGSSSCAQIDWKNRGKAPAGYVKGVALTWAKAVCNRKRADVVATGAAVTTNTEKDAFALYSAEFDAAGLSNAKAGLDAARHAYTLLIGLGMRESSGEHCVGRDMSASFTESDTAEAGVFQTSYGSRVTNPLLEPMFQKYKNKKGGNCFLDTFKEGVKCSDADWKTWGDGNGADWQTLSKECPAFATEWAAALLRTNGGSTGEWGPLRKHAAEVKPECDAMLKQVETIVKLHPALCKQLK